MDKKTEAREGGPKENGYWVYLLRCRDGSLYCGITTDPERRLEEHNNGRGAKYTRSRGPCELAWLEPADDRPAALRREAEIKALRREEKLKLIGTS